MKRKGAKQADRIKSLGYMKNIRHAAFRSFLLRMVVLLLTLGTLALFSHAAGPGKDNGGDDRIVERVTVRNIQIPIRVFDGKKPVDGLKKEDFQLLLGGKSVPVNGFYEVRNQLKKVVPGAAVSATMDNPPRLFVLLFNLSDHHQDLEGILDTLFTDIVRRDDRIIVITNHFFLSEWVVKDPAAARTKIAGILTKETSKLATEVAWFENELKSIAARLKSRLDDPEERKIQTFPTHLFQEFFLEYQLVLSDIKENYLALPLNQFIRIAEYLKGQRVQKWVLNFYQISHFPLLSTFGELTHLVDKYQSGERDEVGQAAEEAVSAESRGPDPMKVYLYDAKSSSKTVTGLAKGFDSWIRKRDDMLTNDISKAFLNTGATFHTMLLKPINPGFSDDYKYEPFASETEVILKKLSHMTGGSILVSNKMKDFVKDVVTREDVLYMLSYVPPAKAGKKALLEVRVKGKNYRVVYDDQKRREKFSDAKKILDENNPDVEIDSVKLNDNTLTVTLKNIKLIEYEGDTYGAVQARIRISDENAKVIEDFERVFKGIKEEGVFQAKLPELGRGRFNIVLEVKDLFSLKHAISGEAISIEKN